METIARATLLAALAGALGCAADEPGSAPREPFFSTVELEPSDVAVAPDGRILVAGRVSLAPEPSSGWRIVAVTSEGVLDETFAANGFLDLDAGSFNGATKILVEPDGRFLVGGFSEAAGGYALRRFHADGAADVTFGEGGTVARPVSYFWGPRSTLALAREEDGSYRFGYAELYPDARVRVERIEANGASGSSGSVDLGYELEEVHDLVLRPNGGALAVGIVAEPFYQARVAVDAAGNLDTTAPGGGVAVGDVSYDVPLTATTDDEGRVLVLSLGNLRRYDADLALDASFGTAGTLVQQGPVSIDVLATANGIFLPDGNDGIVRLDESGSAVATLPIGSPAPVTVWSLAADSDGESILVAGDSPPGGFLARVRP